MTGLGVVRVFFKNTSRITIASTSIRYMRRQLPPESRTLSSWQRSPTLGIGRECGIVSESPRCSSQSKNPVSSLAAFERGGLFTSPCNQAKGLSLGLAVASVCQSRHIRKRSPNNKLQRTRGQLRRRPMGEVGKIKCLRCAASMPRCTELGR